MQPRVSIKSPFGTLFNERTLSERQPEINEKFSGLILRKIVEIPCPQRTLESKYFFIILGEMHGVVKLNNEWGLTSCAGLLGVRLEYPVALMSGGSRRLWNQLLHGTPSFVLYLFRSALTLAGFSRFRPLPLLLHSLYLPLVCSRTFRILLPYFVRYGEGKDLFHIGRNYSDGVTENRFRERSAESKFSPPARTYKDTAIIIL